VGIGRDQEQHQLGGGRQEAVLNAITGNRVEKNHGHNQRQLVKLGGHHHQRAKTNSVSRPLFSRVRLSSSGKPVTQRIDKPTKAVVVEYQFDRVPPKDLCIVRHSSPSKSQHTM